MNASGPAALLRDFVNTLDLETGVDEIGTPAGLAAWLGGRGTAGSVAGQADADDVTAAVRLREGLRAAMLAHHGPAADPALPRGLEDTLAGLPLRLSLSGGAPVLVPARTGVQGALARVAAAVLETVADGSWPRLKVCVDDTCRWAFLDTSKNRSRAWCSMRVCGNRTKTRAYRARLRDPGSTQKTNDQGA